MPTLDLDWYDCREESTAIASAKRNLDLVAEESRRTAYGQNGNHN